MSYLQGFKCTVYNFLFFFKPLLSIIFSVYNRRVVRVGNGGQVTCPGSYSWEGSEAIFEPGTSHL